MTGKQRLLFGWGGLTAILVLVVVLLVGALSRQRDRTEERMSDLYDVLEDQRNPVPYPVAESGKLESLEERVARLEAGEARLETVPRRPATVSFHPPRTLRERGEMDDGEDVLDEIPCRGRKGWTRSPEIGLGIHHLRAREEDEAFLSFSRASLHYPSRYAGYLYLSHLMFYRGDWMQAMDYLSVVVVRDEEWLSESPSPRSLFKSEEEYGTFLEKLKRHVGVHPEDVDAKILLAFHLYHGGEKTRAKSLAGEALILDGKNRVASELVKVIQREGF